MIGPAVPSSPIRRPLLLEENPLGRAVNAGRNKSHGMVRVLHNVEHALRLFSAGVTFSYLGFVMG